MTDASHTIIRPVVGQLYPNWDFVWHTSHKAFEIDKCQALCELDEQCVQWEIRRKNINVSTLLNTSDSQGELIVDCYLMSREFAEITAEVPHLLVPSPFPFVGGSKGDNQQSKAADPRRRIQSQLLLSGPLVVDSSTLLNFQQHFTSQCAYTVSIWVWIWRPRNGETVDKVVFTTKEVYPRVGRLPALLPAIVYNIGAQPDQFFFAAAQGRGTRDYLGLHRGRVRYHQWIHLALTIEHNTLYAYQDGELLDAVAYGSSELEPLNKCVYDTNMDLRTSSDRSTAAGEQKRQRVSSGKAFYDSLITDPFAAHVNNTVLYVGSQPHSLGRHSTVGMVHGLVVLRNRALTPAQMRVLSEQTRPPSLPHLQALLREHRIPSLEGLCPVEVGGDWYRQREWGLCPEAVCGPVCIDDNIYLHDDPSRSARPQTTLTVLQRAATLSEVLGLEPNPTAESLSALTPLRRDRDDDKADIGYPAGAADADEAGGAEGRGWQSVGGLGARADGMVLGGGALNAFLPIIGPAAWLLQDLLLLALHLIFDAPTGSAGARTTLGPEHAEGVDAGPSSRRSAREGSGIPRNTRERQTQTLYKSAMVLLNDRHSRVPGSHSLLERNFSMWRAAREGPAAAALTLGLWMAEDATAGKKDPRDYPWSFREATLLSQPLHLALGYRQGFHGLSDCFVPAREVEALLAAPEDSYLLGKLLTGPVSAVSIFGAPAQDIVVQAASVAPDVLEQRVRQLTIDYSTATAVGMGDRGRVAVDSPGGTAREAYSFAVNERGEVELVSSSLPAAQGGARDSPSVTERDAAPADWLEVFVGLSTDNITAALSNQLRPLAEAGLSATFLRKLILDKQMRRGRARSREGSHAASAERSDTAASTVAVADTTPDPVASAAKGRIAATECKAAAAHYFPVTQYVAAQFGASHSGAGPMEEVRLIVTGGAPEGHRGEDDELHQHTEAEAFEGNADAQTWLAKKYFWGLGGVERNEMAARRWFERAAAQGDPEGLYNVGIFHNNGQAGLPQNERLAMEHFHRAADHPQRPSPLAMNAVGNHYLHSPTERNHTKALEYFLKAAALHSDDAHFSLAMMYREGQGGPRDVPRSVAHLAVAASWGHMRALNFLAHALYDEDSWLAQYGREHHLQRRKQAMASVLSGDRPYHSHSGGVAGIGPPATSVSSSNSSSSSNATAAADALLHSSLVFDAFELIKIYLPGGSVIPLPYPLGNPAGSCEAALPLLKYIAEMSYRPKDVTSQALRSFIKGDMWSALDLFEEAADLGVAAAQENAAYLLEQLAPAECLALQEGLAEKTVDSAAVQAASDAVRDSGTVQDHCEAYMHRLATHRWAQLAGAGEPRAMRKVAATLLDPQLQLQLQLGSEASARDAATLFALAGEQGDTESLLRLGWMLYEGSHGVAQNRTAARELFNAALQLEVEAEGTLDGLMDPPDEQAADAGAGSNQTLTEKLAEYEAALRRHQHTRRWHAAGYASPTTGGAAPALALAVVAADHWLGLLGANTTVAQLRHRLSGFATTFLPASVLEWSGLDTALDAAQKRRPGAKSAAKGWMDKASSVVGVLARRLARWQQMYPELHTVAREVALLLLIVLLCTAVLRTLWP